jgi:LPXTG-motif cell wall-anchored protein
MRAVLDPSKDNIAMLDSYSKHWEELAATASGSVADDITTTQGYVATLWSTTSKPLKEMLTGKTMDGEDVDPGTVIGQTMFWSSRVNPQKTGDIVLRDGLGYTENFVNGAINPYADDYNYVDGAYFGELSRSDLDDIFDKIVTSVTTNSRYDFLLKTGSNVVMTDPIGTNMEVKGEPVLRYFGTNYAIDADKTVNGSDDTTNYVEYHWKGTAKRVENSDAKADDSTVDISSIVARVSTSKATGDQTVTFTIPEAVLPTFYPDLARKFYYEELPIRLIFRVGLTEAEEQSLKDKYAETKEITATYYTNKYGNDGVATVTFEPDESDPYYENLSGTVTETKSTNTTQTESYSFVESYDKAADVVTQKLGNNGVLTLSKDNSVTITVQKQWEANDRTHPDSVYIGLFGKGTKTDADGKTSDFAKMYDQTALQESSNWEHTWSKINRVQVEDGITYNYDEFYVCEFVPDGYVANYVDDDGNALLENTDTFDITYYKYTKVDSIEAMSVEDEDDDSVASKNSIASFNSEVGKSILLADKDGNPVYPPDEEEETSESENAEDVSISPMVAGRYELTKVVEPRTFDVVSATSGTVIIKNISGYSLPNTGGSGKLVTFSAITLLFGALLMYILKRRKEMRS